MSGDEWLWDGAGAPDPTEKRLSEALAPLRHAGPAPMLPARRSRAWPVVAALAAAAVGLLVIVPRQGPVAWSMASEAGCPDADCLLAVGREIVPSAETRVVVADIGSLAASAGSRLKLLRSDAKEHRLAIERGVIDVVVNAPPRLLVIETPAARVVDLGCAYRLKVDPSGTHLRVLSGRVALENAGGARFVPAGASASAAAEGRLGLPRFDDASPAFHGAADRLQGAPDDAVALAALIAAARPVDSLTLWHLLPLVQGAQQQAVVEALVGVEPRLSAQISAAAAGDSTALSAVRDELEFLWIFGR